MTAAIVFPTTLFVTGIFKYSNTKKKKREEKKDDVTVDHVFKEFDDINALLGELYKEEEEEQQEEKEKEPSRLERCCDKTLLIMAWTVANLGMYLYALNIL